MWQFRVLNTNDERVYVYVTPTGKTNITVHDGAGLSCRGVPELISYIRGNEIAVARTRSPERVSSQGLARKLEKQTRCTRQRRGELNKRCWDPKMSAEIQKRREWPAVGRGA